MFLGDADFESAKKSDLKKFKMNRSSEKDKIIEAQAELIKNLQKQIKEMDGQVTSLKAQVDMLRAQTDQWRAGSEERHAKGRTVDEIQTARVSTDHDKMRKKGKFESRDKRWKEAIKEESKAKADIAISKNKNTLRFNTTRKSKR